MWSKLVQFSENIQCAPYLRTADCVGELHSGVGKTTTFLTLKGSDMNMFTM